MGGLSKFFQTTAEAFRMNDCSFFQCTGVRMKLYILWAEAFESNGCSFLGPRLQDPWRSKAFRFILGGDGCSSGGGGRAAMVMAFPVAKGTGSHGQWKKWAWTLRLEVGDLHRFRASRRRGLKE